MLGSNRNIFSYEDYVDRANKARSVEELCAVFRNAIHQHGLDRMHFCLLSDHNNIGLKAGIGFIENYPQDWMSYYFEQGLDKVDPVISYAYQKGNTFKWRKIETRLNLTAPQRYCLNAGREAGLYHGIGAPMFGPYRFAGFGLASSEPKDSFDGNLDMISAYCTHFYTAFQRLYFTEDQLTECQNIYLTPKEREILIWVARGKSSPVIADILGLSLDGVKHHLRNIYKKLNTNSRTVAACKAISYGLITP